MDLVKKKYYSLLCISHGFLMSRPQNSELYIKCTQDGGKGGEEGGRVKRMRQRERGRGREEKVGGREGRKVK